MGWKKNRKKGDLAFEGGFFDIPILGDMANVLSSAAVDMAGVSADAATDVADATINIAGQTATGGTMGDRRIPVKEGVNFTEDMAQEMLKLAMSGDIDALQDAFDTWGLEPSTGWAGDLGSALISMSKGEFGPASIAFASMIPFADVLTKPKKIQQMYKKYSKNLDGIDDKIKKSDAYKATDGGMIDESVLDDILKDSNIPKTLIKDIKKDVASKNSIYVNSLMSGKGALKDKRRFGRLRDFMNKEGQWVNVPGLDRGLKRWEKFLLADAIYKFSDTEQGIFSERGISGMTRGGDLADILYAATPGLFMGERIGSEWTPRGVSSLQNAVNYVGTGLGFPEGSELIPSIKRYDKEGKLIGGGKDGVEFDINKYLQGIDVKTKKKKEKQKQEEAKFLNIDAKNVLDNSVFKIYNKGMDDWDMKLELKEFYNSLGDKERSYLEEQFPDIFSE